MDTAESKVVSRTLERPELHKQWVGDYYTDESSRFYEAAFDHIATRLASREKSTFLDAGCGDGSHTIRLARRGFPVVALDFSPYVLTRAGDNVASHNLGHMVRFEQGSLLQLPFSDGAFELVLCWGVLMHIPEVETAISELARVVKLNGFLIISEVNMWSIERTLMRSVRRALGRTLIRRLRGREPADLRVRPAGAEYWYQTDAGPLFCREARISWLTAALESRGFVVKERIAGQFSERYTSVPTKLLKRCVHAFNEAWFARVRWPQPATGNLLLFQKIRTPAAASVAAI